MKIKKIKKINQRREPDSMSNIQNDNRVGNIYADAVISHLSVEKKTFFVKEKDGEVVTLIFPVGMRSLPAVNVILSILPGGKCDMSLCVGNGKNLSNGYRTVLMDILNRLNDMYAFASFSMDNSDGEIRMTMNFYVDNHNTGEMVERYIYTFSNICEDGIPEILKVLWNDKKDKENSNNEIDEEIDYSDEYGDDEEYGDYGDDEDYDFEGEYDGSSGLDLEFEENYIDESEVEDGVTEDDEGSDDNEDIFEELFIHDEASDADEKEETERKPKKRKKVEP